MNSYEKLAKFPHLYLYDWPFREAASEESAGVWADRTPLKQQVENLSWRFANINTTSLHLLWADLGAGKTHTLLYLKRLCSESDNSNTQCIYVETPKTIKSFINIYTAIFRNMPLEQIVGAYKKCVNEYGKDFVSKLFGSMPETTSALYCLVTGTTDTRNLATLWMSNSALLTRHELANVGVGKLIKTTDEAVSVLSGLINLLLAAQMCTSVVIILDDFQHAGETRRNISSDISIGLRKWYNGCPKSLNIILSFASHMADNIKYFIDSELLRVAYSPRLMLPELSHEEAVQFVEDLMSAYRTPGAPVTTFPFSREAVASIIVRLQRTGKLLPGKIVKAFDSIMFEANFEIAKGTKREINPQYAISLFERVGSDIINV
jgi:hypothetical protein